MLDITCAIYNWLNIYHGGAICNKNVRAVENY